MLTESCSPCGHWRAAVTLERVGLCHATELRLDDRLLHLPAPVPHLVVGFAAYRARVPHGDVAVVRDLTRQGRRIPVTP